jgi:hypothetical protein
MPHNDTLTDAVGLCGVGDAAGHAIAYGSGGSSSSGAGAGQSVYPHQHSYPYCTTDTTVRGGGINAAGLPAAVSFSDLAGPPAPAPASGGGDDAAAHAMNRSEKGACYDTWQLLFGHCSSVTCIALSEKMGVLASASDRVNEATVLVHTLHNGECRYQLKVPLPTSQSRRDGKEVECNDGNGRESSSSSNWKVAVVRVALSEEGYIIVHSIATRNTVARNRGSNDNDAYDDDDDDDDVFSSSLHCWSLEGILVASTELGS